MHAMNESGPRAKRTLTGNTGRSVQRSVLIIALALGLALAVGACSSNATDTTTVPTDEVPTWWFENLFSTSNLPNDETTVVHSAARAYNSELNVTAVAADVTSDHYGNLCLYWYVEGQDPNYRLVIDASAAGGDLMPLTAKKVEELSQTAESAAVLAAVGCPTDAIATNEATASATTRPSPEQSSESAPIPTDPLSPVQHVWCLGSDENRARVVLTGLLLDLDHTFPMIVHIGAGRMSSSIGQSSYQAAVRGFLADPDGPEDQSIGVLPGGGTVLSQSSEWQEDRDTALALADSWPEGDHWLRHEANTDGPQPGDQPSPWATACATAYEAFRG